MKMQTVGVCLCNHFFGYRQRALLCFCIKHAPAVLSFYVDAWDVTWLLTIEEQSLMPVLIQQSIYAFCKLESASERPAHYLLFELLRLWYFKSLRKNNPFNHLVNGEKLPLEPSTIARGSLLPFSSKLKWVYFLWDHKSHRSQSFESNLRAGLLPAHFNYKISDSLNDSSKSLLEHPTMNYP